MPNVQMPDGTVVAFPDDMPHEQIGGMIASKFPDASKQSFLERVGNDWNKRADQGKLIMARAATGELPIAAAPTQMYGKVIAGGASDLIGEAAKSLYNTGAENMKMIPGAGLRSAIADKVGQGIGAGYNYIAKSPVGTAVGEAVNKYKDFAKSNPNIANQIDSVANIGTMIPVADAAPAALNMAGNIASDVKNAILPAVKSPITRDMVRDAGSNAYRAVEDSGTGITPQWTNRMGAVLENSQQKPFFNGMVLTSEQKAINDALSEFLPAKGQAAKLSDIQALDSTLGDKASMAYVAGDANKARILSDVQDKIRAMLHPDNLIAGDVTGGTEGIEALTQHAIPLWSTQAKMADIEKIITRANAMDNPATSMKTGFRNLMLNEGKMAQYPEAVQKLIIKAAKSGKTDDLLGILGSRLNPIISGAVGGPHGAALAYGTSMVGRAARTALKGDQANAVLNALVENVRPSIEKYSGYTAPTIAAPAASFPAEVTIGDIMKMSPVMAKAELDKLTQARRMGSTRKP